MKYAAIRTNGERRNALLSSLRLFALYHSELNTVPMVKIGIRYQHVANYNEKSFNYPCIRDVMRRTSKIVKGLFLYEERKL